MLDVLRAEALKIRYHRATWLMVWIFPIFLGLALIVQVGRDLIYVPSVPAQAATAAGWLQQSTMAWRVPLDGTGRFIIAGFSSLVFAGEYGWNTWKLIVPARARWQLIVGKWCIAAGFVMLALTACSLLILIGQLMGGPGAPSDLTLTAIAIAHGTAAVNAILPLLYIVTLAGLFAVLTGSLFATVGLSIVMLTMESALLLIALVAHNYAPWLTTTLLKVLPFYHSANFVGAMKGAPLILPLGSGQTMSFAWQPSAIILAGWIVIIGAGTLVRFARQDLN